MSFRSMIPFGLGGSGERGSSIESFHREVERLFSDFSRNFYSPLWPQDIKHMLTPNVDISETEKEFIVTAELPGLEEKDIEATISNKTLTIKGEKKIDRKEEKGGYHLVERSSGTFMRSFHLPFEANTNSLDATFKNGVLTIRMKKPDTKVSESNKIKIKRID